MSDWITETKNEILAELQDDDVGLWEFVWIIERKVPEATGAEVRTMVLQVVQDLLEAHEMLPGKPPRRAFPSFRGMTLRSTK